MKYLITFIIVVAFGQALLGQTYYGPNYVHLSNATNCAGDYTILDGSIVGINSADHLLITHIWGPDVIHDEYMKKSHGLWYANPEWSIFDETEAPADTSLAFNVLNPQANGVSFTHTVTAANIHNNWSDIDNALLNSTPSAVFFITKTWDNGVYDTAHVGIWYDSFNSKWAIYNENGSTALKVNSTYNIFVPVAGTSYYKHHATGNYYVTELDNPLLNGNPDARIFVVHDFTDNSTTQGYINDEIGVWYDGSYWTIYNENPADTLFNGATFNVLIIRNNPVGIDNISSDAGKIKVSPNPAKDKISVLLNTSMLKSLKEIRISSMDGQTVLQKEYNGNAANPILFDLSTVSQGLYVLTALSENGTYTAKVSVVR